MSIALEYECRQIVSLKICVKHMNVRLHYMREYQLNTPQTHIEA
jgi:hypothetical protein